MQLKFILIINVLTPFAFEIFFIQLILIYKYMSHFSRIKTSICNFDILQKSLKDLGFQYDCQDCTLQDANGNLQSVDLIVKSKNTNMLGFIWDGNEYNLVADLQFWNQSISVERFIEKISQQYALNSILKESTNEGFHQVNREFMQDGSIKLVIQRWN